MLGHSTPPFRTSFFAVSHSGAMSNLLALPFSQGLTTEAASVRRRPEITSSFSGLGCPRPNRVVPFRKDRTAFDSEFSPFCFGDLSPLAIQGRIQACLAMKSSGGARPPNEFQHPLITRQRFARPVLTHEAEHPVFDQIP